MPNNGYNSLLGLVTVRQTFCIFNLISNPKILMDFQQRNHNPKPLCTISELNANKDRIIIVNKLNERNEIRVEISRNDELVTEIFRNNTERTRTI